MRNATTVIAAQVFGPALIPIPITRRHVKEHLTLQLFLANPFLQKSIIHSLIDAFMEDFLYFLKRLISIFNECSTQQLKLNTSDIHTFTLK